MQATTKPIIKTADISEKGIYILRKRLHDCNFELFLDKFAKTFDNAEYNVFLCKSEKSKERLKAVIKYGENNKKHIKEDYFSYLFNKPMDFINKIEKQVKKDLNSIAKIK